MIEQALLQIREDMARLVSAMHDKGHTLAEADLELCHDLQMRVSLRTGPIGLDGERAFVSVTGTYRHAYTFIHGTDYADMLSRARDEIARMDLSIALACEAWFQTDVAA